MNVLITGICGFVGSTLARVFREMDPACTVYGMDNLVRPGSELNRLSLQQSGVKVIHGDIRIPSDFELLPVVDWVIDAAANPSVLASVDGQTSSRQLVEHNLVGTLNILEYCKRHGSGLILLSSSRVYSISALTSLSLELVGDAYSLKAGHEAMQGVSVNGIGEGFSTDPPVSLYGSTKRTSELLALEYGETFGFPVWINRCGVLAGAGQFGRAEQGVFSYWIHSWLRNRPLTYTGFGGCGHQVRDCLHPRDLVPLLNKQMRTFDMSTRIVNIGGGAENSMSLAELSNWCAERFGHRDVAAEMQERRFDIPWLVMDSTRALQLWDWRPVTPIVTILDEIAGHAERHPGWLELSGVP
jgi:CDP-paratose 2-epimerase